jgi:glycosyltransferase involved in cell wall biosynthesis
VTAAPSTAAASGANAAFRDRPPPSLSVVIPTYRRTDTIGRVLDALAASRGLAPGEAEVVVCDDASGDDTPRLLAAAAARLPLAMAWLSLGRNGGPARARNAALDRARGRAILLLGDDIVAPPDLLARHAAWHGAHPADTDALLGRTTWAPELNAGALMRWLEDGGRRFAFDFRGLPSGRPVSGRSFYTSNVSFKRALLDRAGPFDESFPFASHEDLELGDRFEREGMRLFYDPDAVAYHWHPLDWRALRRRIYRMGYSSVLYWRKVQRRGALPRRLARAGLTRLAATAPARAGARSLARRGEEGDAGCPRPFLWSAALTALYWCGAADAARGRPAAEDGMPGR